MGGCLWVVAQAALLANVRDRYTKKDIYTLTGQILLAMNPFEALSIYNESIMANYKGIQLGKVRTHVLP